MQLQLIFTMKIYLILPLLVLAGFGFRTGSQIQYPSTTKSDITTNYFGVNVADPYRWLEFDGTPESAKWVEAENLVTDRYLEQIPFRKDLATKLQSLSSLSHYSKPRKENGVYYYFKSNGLQDQAVLYSQKDLKSEPEIFLDPKTLAPGENIKLADIAFSKKGKYTAYTTKKNGSEWQTASVMETQSKKILSDKLEWIKMSTIQWQGDEGFYYSRYPEPKGNGRFSNQSRFHSVFFHKIGDQQSADKLIYEDREHPYRYHFAQVTEDDRFLVLYISEGTANAQIMFKNLDKGDKATFRTILDGFKYEAEVFDNDKKNLYVRTNISAPRYRVVAVNLTNPYVNNWETMIPEQNDVLQAIKPAGGNWFGTYLKDASSTLSQFTMGGYKLNDISLPPFASVEISAGHSNDNEFLYSYSTFTQPGQLYRLNIRDSKSELLKKSELTYSPADFETKQVFFNSEDGTKIPMFLTYKKGIQLNGQNPVLLSGFGGLNQSSTPSFDAMNMAFMQQGGIYALVNTRGGSEYGEKWHKAGMGKEKQNAIDDFSAAAEYLQEEKYTSPLKMAIAGSTHGGLLVTAAMVQRPELFKVVLADEALTDMLRYEKFTTAYGWVGEYGTSDDREEFDNLYSNSPLHNLKPGGKYPATFITTGNMNDNIVPAHSYKFAATMQEVQAAENPILIRVSDDAGTKGQEVALLEKQTDRLAFLMYNLGMKP
jgi:prolyl oligopeptidase